MPAASATTSYQPLSNTTSTRVIVLQPGLRESAIYAHIQEVDLKCFPTYEAVSYTWGNADDEEIICLSGSSIQIRKNLYALLRRLRQAKRQRMLWIDALSICQTDLDEKAQQVAMIGDIFMQAKRVLAWVGEHADGSEMLFQQELQKWFVRWRYYCGLYHSEALSEAEHAARKLAWFNFLNRTYWQRSWIVQELILAKSIVIHCGDDRQDWDSFFHGHSMWRYYEFEGLPEISRESHVTNDVPIHPGSPDLAYLISRINSFDYCRVQLGGRRLRILQESENPFHHLLQAFDLVTHGALSRWVHEYRILTLRRTMAFMDLVMNLSRDCQCLDRRDKIYALLSLSDRESNPPNPNYAIDIPTLFWRVHKWHSASLKNNASDKFSRQMIKKLEKQGYTYDALKFVSYDAAGVFDLMGYLELSMTELLHVVDMLLDENVALSGQLVELQYTGEFLAAAYVAAIGVSEYDLDQGAQIWKDELYPFFPHDIRAAAEKVRDLVLAAIERQKEGTPLKPEARPLVSADFARFSSGYWLRDTVRAAIIINRLQSQNHQPPLIQSPQHLRN